MTSENIIFAAVCGLCALIFGAIALWASKRQTPMHFWSGTVVRPEEITDITSYNRENAIMWAIYAVSMVVAGIVSLFSVLAGAALLVVICTWGVIILINTYKRIHSKYKQ